VQLREQLFAIELLTLWRRLSGIEAVVAVGLYLLWIVSPSFWLQMVFRKQTVKVVEVYVFLCFAFTFVVWLKPPFFFANPCLHLSQNSCAYFSLTLAALCSYFSLSTILALLHVVFLSKVLGPVVSKERSLMLFLVNVAQFVFMFAIWYKLIIGSRGSALFYALLVLGTLGYPDNPAAHAVVGLQIATDFLLFAIFLAHLLGRTEKPPEPN
jgi:hypothetical protein